MPRYKLTVEYDGTGLAGWQKQKDQPSVQEYLEAAAEKLTGKISGIVAAGRTDAGVHALGQVVHVDIERDLTTFNVMHGMNYHLLPQTMQVIVVKAEQVEQDFHARFSAKQRTYFYRIINRQARLALDATRAWHIPEKLDVQAMQEATRILVGTHDFTTFRSRMCQAASPVKTLDLFNIVEKENEIHLHIEARSFLHHQVRNMAGALRLIGNGKWKNKDLESALMAKDRIYGGVTAPPQGLFLCSVAY